MKKIPAIMAGLATTGLILGAVLAIGVNAVVTSASAASLTEGVYASPAVSMSANPDELVAQYQAREAEYQAREAQYQALLEQAQENSRQAENQLAQYEALFSQLQEMGVIRQEGSGEISIFRPRAGEHEDHDFEDD